MRYRSSAHEGLSYRDALRLLDHDEGAVSPLVERLTGLAAGATVIATVGAMDFFALRDQLVSWGTSALAAIRHRADGRTRFDRSERLAAAHTVLVVTAFYEALDETLRQGGSELFDLELTGAEQLALAADGAPPESYRDLVNGLVELAVPMPSPHRPYEDTLTDLRGYYSELERRLRTFLVGLADITPDRDRIVRTVAVLHDLVDAAIRRYEIAYRSLAAEVPEFAVWAQMIDSQGTRGSLTAGLSALAAQLAALDQPPGAVIAHCRRELSRFHRSRLDRPILDASDAPKGVVLPTLDVAYLGPQCRTAVRDGFHVSPASEFWWSDKPLVADTYALIVAHVVTPEAVRAPLIVLGRPGSGKSALTKVIAGRLPEQSFTPVRVELRRVSSNVPVQTQIEQAIYNSIDERLTWAAFARSAGGALPVVLLDGFDELIQASVTDQADYLERVAEFQQRQAELGRPVAVVVTTRTTVVDRVRFPVGSVVVRLEPFGDDQIGRWLAVWNDANAAEFERRGVRTLPQVTALVHRELAAEPLLLLMLALYDAGANALQDAGSSLARAELYERLFSDFVRREVRKCTPNSRPTMSGGRSN